MIGRDQTAGACHVFDHETWAARYVFTHMSGQGAGVSVEAAACGEADNQPDSFAFIKVVGLGRRTANGNERHDQAQNPSSFHESSPSRLLTTGEILQ
jgi:hypothetical protein